MKLTAEHVQKSEADQVAKRTLLANLLCILAIIVIVLSIFSKTVFKAQPISKSFAISSMDSLYYPQNKSASISSPIDPCIYFFQIPTAIAAERIWRQGQIPLWNPDNACGHPILANVESGVFSWHHFFFPSSSEYLYNLGIVARIIVAAVGAYLFAKANGIHNKFSILAGLSYALCPNILREVELTKETWSFPWILLLFTTFGRTKSLKNLSIMALACGLVCATIHPECSFNTIVLGCLLVTMQQCIIKETATITERTKIAAGSVAWLMLIGICVFCAAAPVLLPFAEFMQNSDCYKFDNHAPPVVSLPAFLLALVHPAMGGTTAFLGIFCLPLAVVSFYKPRREIVPLLACTIIAVCVASLVGPLYQLFCYRPFNMLEPLYLQPICILFLSCLMADGLQKLAGPAQDKKAPLLFIFSCIAVVLVPPILGFYQVPLNSLDWEVDKYKLVWGAWTKDAGIAIGCCLLLTLSYFKKIPAVRTIEIVMVGSLLSQLTISRMSLPTHPSFSYKPAGPVEWLKSHPGRMLAMGRHFIVPNINMVWNLSDFRHFNGLYPPRYLNFQALCGGRRYYATHYRYEDSLTKVLDLASVRYVTSRSPVYDSRELRAALNEPLRPVGKLAQDFQISTGQIFWDRHSRQALCLLRWSGSEDIIKNYKVQFAVLNGENKEVWSSDEFPLANNDQYVPDVSQVGRWAIPRGISNTEPLKLVLRVNNLWSNGPLWPVEAKLGTVRNNLVLADIRMDEVKSSFLEAEKRFRLQEELSDGTRIYENMQALPEAFSIPSTNGVFAQNKAEADRLITQESFNPRAYVVLETKKATRSQQDQAQTNSTKTVDKSASSLTVARVTRSNANQVEISIMCPEPSYLVLTDTFYPGWKAYLNGSNEELEILRANYLFRAVKIPKGKCLVVFKYQPVPFFTGLTLLALLLSGLSTMLIYQKVTTMLAANKKTIVE